MIAPQNIDLRALAIGAIVNVENESVEKTGERSVRIISQNPELPWTVLAPDFFVSFKNPVAGIVFDADNLVRVFNAGFLLMHD